MFQFPIRSYEAETNEKLKSQDCTVSFSLVYDIVKDGHVEGNIWNQIRPKFGADIVSTWIHHYIKLQLSGSVV